MHHFFARFIAGLLWIRERVHWLSTRQRGRATVLFSSLFFTFFGGHIVQAQDSLEQGVQMLAAFAFYIAAAITKAIVLVISVLMPIMLYNDFVTNPVVTAGWAIMRDTVNMFFVVVLIAIAFGTIFGHSKFQWQQQVPKLMIFALVINFSKTLSGIMIDFGQVIMLTFANALREIAAGNFIQLLGLNELYSLSSTSTALTGANDAASAGLGDAFGYFAGGIMAVAVTIMVLSTLVILVVILLYRIIMLWVLVVLAPLAWFMGGAKDLVNSNAYADWWTKFKCLVAVGPVLTFFLWLTLAVASAGNVAQKSGFDVSSVNSADFNSKFFEPENFMSFLIGMAMLYAGFDAAQQICSSMSGGFLGKTLQKAKSGAVATMAAGGLWRAGRAGSGLGLRGGAIGARLGLRGARGAGRLAGWTGGVVSSKTPLGNLVRAAGKKRAAMNERLAKGRLTPTWVRDRVMGDVDAMRAGHVEGVAKQKKGLEGRSSNYILSEIQRLGKTDLNSKLTSTDTKDRAAALMQIAMSNGDISKQARASGSLEGLSSQVLPNMMKDYKHDEGKRSQIEAFQKKNADITNSANLLDNWDDASGLDDNALADAKVQERLKQIKSNRKGKDGEYMSAYDAIVEGHAGDKKEAVLKAGTGDAASGALYERMGARELAQVDVSTIGEHGSGKALGNALRFAMEDGDKKRSQDIIAQMGAKYSSVDDDGRLEMALAMDGARATLEGSGDKSLLRNFDEVRDTAERLVLPPLAPPLTGGMSGSSYAAKYFGNASEDRRVAGIGDLDRQAVEVTQAQEVQNSQRDDLIGTERKRLKDELDALGESLAQAKQKINEDLKNETNKLQDKRNEASEWRDLVQADPDSSKGDKYKAKSDYEKAQQAYEAASARSKTPSGRKAVADKDERVIKIRTQIEVKTKEGTDLDVGEIKGVSEITEKIGALTRHMEEIRAARDAIK